MSSTQDRRRILVVDDAPAVAESLAMIFSSHGYEVSVAHSAEDAIEEIATVEPATAFVDIMLPGMNGIEFAKVLKSNWPNCKVVLISGYPGAAEFVERARREGYSLQVLPKPLDPNQFLAIARGRLCDEDLGATGPTMCDG